MQFVRSFKLLYIFTAAIDLHHRAVTTVLLIDSRCNNGSSPRDVCFSVCSYICRWLLLEARDQMSKLPIKLTITR